MKTNLITLLLCFLALTFTVSAQNTQTDTKQDKTAKPTYAELLAKLQNGDTKIDYKALRMAYTETEEYSPYGTGADETNPMFKAFNDKKYKDAIKLAEAILKDNYVEINSHYIISLASAELGDAKKAEFHKAVFIGLINSIGSGGKDGKSAKTAFEVISVPEEYVLINALGYERGSQALVSEDGRQFDVLSVTNTKTKEKVKLYFNVDIVFKGYGKIFGK